MCQKESKAVEGTTQSEVITYEDVVVRLVRYANITDFSVIDRMTVVQYSLIMEGLIFDVLMN